MSEEAKTQVEFYKKQRYRTDLFGIGAVVFDMITIGRSPEKFYESIRKFETTSVEDIVKRYDTLRRGEIEGENPDLSEIPEPFRHDNDPTKRYPDNDIVEFILKCMLYQSEGTFYEQNRADPGQASKALSDQMRDLLAEYKNKQLLPRQLIDSSILIDRPQNFGPPITGQSLQFDREIARLQGLDPWPDVEQLNEPALLAANRLRYGAYYFSQIVKLVRTKISSDNKSDETHLRQILPTYISLKRENGQATLDFEAAPSLQVRKELRDNRLEQLIRAPTNPFVPNWIASIRRDIRLFRSDPMARDSALSCKYRFRDASLFRLNIAAGDWVVCQGQLWQVMAPIEDDRLTIQFENTTADNKGIIWTKDGYADGTYFSALDPFKYYLDMLGLYLQHLIFTCSPLTTTTRDRLDIKALLYSLEIGPTIFINSPPAEFDDIAGGRLREILTNYVHLFLMLALHESPDLYYAHYLEELAQDNGLSDGSPDSDRLNRIGKRVLNWVDGYAKHQYAQILNLLNNSENSDDYPTTLKSLDNLPDDFKQMVDSLAQNRFDIEKTVKHSGLIAWSESFQPVMEPVTST